MSVCGCNHPCPRHRSSMGRLFVSGCFDPANLGGLTLILNTPNPAWCWGSEKILSLARKNYTDEFRRQAVDLYESTPGATLRGIADDLGISRGTLWGW